MAIYRQPIPYRNDPPDLRLDSILHITSDLYFSKNMASAIVGSRTRLEELVAKDLIRMKKPTKHQHGKWRCNASDVLRFAKSMLEK